MTAPTAVPSPPAHDLRAALLARQSADLAAYERAWLEHDAACRECIEWAGWGAALCNEGQRLQDQYIQQAGVVAGWGGERG